MTFSNGPATGLICSGGLTPRADLSKLIQRLAVIACAIAFTGCAALGGGDRQAERPSADKVKPNVGMVSVKPGGGYYDRDGPPEVAPADLARIPDAVPRKEALLAWSNRPYTVFGQRYIPMTLRANYKQTGIASWYGKQFHGRKTSSGEVYDMLGMTAAHPTLPIPSFVRVTNVRNGKQVVVRVNDRGPFLQNRLIDLSFAAATKLDYVNSGHTQVEIELIRLDENGDVLDEPVQTASVKAAPVPAAQTVAVVASASSAAAKPQAVPPSAQSSAQTVLASAQASLSLTQSVVNVSASPQTAVGPQDELRATAPRIESPLTKLDSPKPVLASGKAETPSPSPSVVLARSNDLGLVTSKVTRPNEIYLQLGAFSTAENAESAVLKVARSLPDLGTQISVAQDGSLHKIRAGPYDAIAAIKVADMVQAATGYRPFKIQASTN